MDMTELNARINEIDADLRDLELIRTHMKHIRDRYVSAQINTTKDPEPTVIRRVVSQCGTKAVTFAFKLIHGQNQIHIGVADSGSLKQFTKKDGASLAKERIGMIIMNSHTRLSREHSLIPTFCSAIGCESNYESISKTVRPLINKLVAHQQITS